jgi:SAM-dependent methyltransferase
VPACDCCGANEWVRLFSLSGHDLGRCSVCELHYIAEMPSPSNRMTEIEAGHFGKTEVPDSKAWLRGEQVRLAEFLRYIETAARFAPAGRWLDIGCGTGVLMDAASSRGVTIEGLELDSGRREIAANSGATVHSQPLEDLGLAANRYAAVTMINVFSHVISPTSTLAEVHRILVEGGIVLIQTSEIGQGTAQAKHQRTWNLGDHLSFLGDGTIEKYAEKTGMELVYRDRVWQPEASWTRERMLLPGPSGMNNAIKAALRIIPGALPAARWYATHVREADSPLYTSTLILQKPK